MIKSNIIEGIFNKYKESIVVNENPNIYIEKDGKYDIIINNKTNIFISDNINIYLKITGLFNINLKIGKNSNAFIYMLNKKNIQTNITIDENSYLETFSLNLGSISSDIQVDLIGANSSFIYNLGLYADNDEVQLHNTSINHLIHNTSSNINKIGILNDKAKATFHIKSHINKNCFKSEAYQKSKIINLSDDANAAINPILLIDNFDCLGEHGAIISKVNEEDLYYIESRAVNRKDALKLITLGSILEKVPVYLIDEITKILEEVIK